MNVHTNTRTGDDAAVPSDAPAFETFLQENPQVQYIDCIFVDLCGVVRGKRIARTELERVFASGLQIPYTIYFLDARGDMVDGVDRATSNGAREGMARPIPGTLTRVNWSQRPHGQVLMTLCDAKGEPYFGEPRNVLARVVERFADLGLAPAVGCSLEFYFVDRERTKNGTAQTPAAFADNTGTSAEVLAAIVAAAQMQGLPPIEVATTAVAGQFRISLKQSLDAVRAGDHTVLLRQIVRAVARHRGIDATFMSKPYLDRAGSAMRVRAAVFKGEGENAFDDGRIDGDAMLRFAIGGLQAVMAESIALFAPNANSYRRFVAPAAAARNKRWGYGRGATVIGAGGESEARFVEHRLAGADANPYLVQAAILTGIHHGIVAHLDPGAPFEGDAANFVDQTLPFAVDAALVALENGSIMREYLGPAYVDLYCATKRTELDRFRNHIPAHEYDWYI
jgi:glutamine synthetase